MDVKYQIFVSSTFDDLKDERRAVIEAIMNLQHIPVGMELFQASDQDQWTYIKKRIDESDYYVLIIAERYGSELDGKSYTQMEYEYAVETGVPIITFQLHKDVRAGWPSNKVDHDKREKVEAFRKLTGNRMVRFWKNADELGGKVATALIEQMRVTPRVGWVRADSVASPKVLEELAALSDERRVLQDRLALLGDDERLRIPDHAVWRIKEFLSRCVSELNDYQYIEGELNLLDIFEYVAPLLAEGCRPKDIKEQMEAVENVVYEMEVADTFLRELISNNIVQVQTFYPNGYGAGELKTYFLSDYGKEFLMYTKEWRERERVAAYTKALTDAAAEAETSTP